MISILFTEYLNHFRDADNRLGDFARDALEDEQFPKSDDYHIIYSYLVKRNCDEIVIDAFQETFKRYVLSKKGENWKKSKSYMRYRGFEI